MTKFQELQEIIARNKNKANVMDPDSKMEDEALEVAGSEGTKKPIVSFGDDETDMDLIDQLYFKPKHKPLMGEFAEKWD